MQDYLSRYWADDWTNIGVEYNCQIHQMFYALSPGFAYDTVRSEFVEPGGERKVNVLHYSGEEGTKPWDRLLLAKYADIWPDRSKDEEFLTRWLELFRGYALWGLRDPEAWKEVGDDYWGYTMCDDNEVYKVPNFKRGETWGGPEAVPTAAIEGTLRLSRTMLKAWFDAFERLEEEVFRPAGIPDLVAALQSRTPDLDGFNIIPMPTPSNSAPASGSALAPRSTSLPLQCVTAAAAEATFKKIELLKWGKSGDWWAEKRQQPRGGPASPSMFFTVSVGAPFSEETGSAQISVSFSEGGRETWSVQGDSAATPGTVQLWGKVVGNSGVVRPFTSTQSEPAEAFGERIRLWSQALPDNSFVMLAFVYEPVEASRSSGTPSGGLSPLVRTVLEALEKGLGICTPANESGDLERSRAFAAVGRKACLQKQGQGDWLTSTGPDAAFVSGLLHT